MRCERAIDLLHARYAARFESLCPHSPEFPPCSTKRTLLPGTVDGVLLAYNLLRSQMVKMATSMRG